MITKPHVQTQRDDRSERGSRRISRASLIALSIVILLAGILDASAQALEDFGYNRIEAKGGRPLLIILTEFAGSPALRDNAASYFGDLAFNTFAPASNPSLKTYYTENSNGRFFWERAGVGVVGPYSFTQDDIGTDSDGKLSRITLALKAAANDGFDFAQFDENGDQTITSSELGILIIDNLPWKNGPALAGANRASDPACFKLDGSNTNLCLRGVVAGQDASFMTLAHERWVSRPRATFMARTTIARDTRRWERRFTTMSMIDAPTIWTPSTRCSLAGSSQRCTPSTCPVPKPLERRSSSRTISRSYSTVLSICTNFSCWSTARLRPQVAQAMTPICQVTVL